MVHLLKPPWLLTYIHHCLTNPQSPQPPLSFGPLHLYQGATKLGLQNAEVLIPGGEVMEPSFCCLPDRLFVDSSFIQNLALSRVPQSYVALHPSSDEANNVTILVLLKTNANPTPVRQVWNRSRCSASDFKFNYTFTHSVPLVWRKCTCHSTQLFSPGSWSAPSDPALHHLGNHKISVSHGFRFLSLSSQLAFLMRSVLAPLLLFQETYKELDKAISVTSPSWLQSKTLTKVVLFGHPKQAPPWRSRWSTAPKSHVAWQG